MSPASVEKALPVIGTVAVLGFLLPGIESAWQSAPDASPDSLRHAEIAYIGGAVALGLLAAYGQGSFVPLLLATLFAVGVVSYYEHASRSSPSEAV